MAYKTTALSQRFVINRSKIDLWFHYLSEATLQLKVILELPQILVGIYHLAYLYHRHTGCE